MPDSLRRRNSVQPQRPTARRRNGKPRACPDEARCGMTSTPDELARIAAQTLAHYSARVDDFWAGTRDHDVSQNIAALLRHIRATPPFSLLDLGCGPGRDLKTFSELGHAAVGLEGEPRFADMARSHSGCEVWTQNLFDMHLPPARFDGVFANAVLFHVPSSALPGILQQLHATLKEGGVLFSSNPRGEGQEGWRAGRYGTWHDLPGWRAYLGAAGFTELEHYYRPEGLPREQQPWLASVWRKEAAPG
jgi:SAM-dependent methyltransferase